MTRAHLITATALIATALSIGTANADGSDRRNRLTEIDRQLSLDIEQGRYKGELTRREYRDLNSEAATIKDLERRAASDGHISRREFREVREAQDMHAQRIKAETSDTQKSWWRRWLYLHR